MEHTTIGEVISEIVADTRNNNNWQAFGNGVTKLTHGKKYYYKDEPIISITVSNRDKEKIEEINIYDLTSYNTCIISTLSGNGFSMFSHKTKDPNLITTSTTKGGKRKTSKRHTNKRYSSKRSTKKNTLSRTRSKYML